MKRVKNIFADVYTDSQNPRSISRRGTSARLAVQEPKQQIAKLRRPRHSRFQRATRDISHITQYTHKLPAMANYIIFIYKSKEREYLVCIIQWKNFNSKIFSNFADHGATTVIVLKSRAVFEVIHHVFWFRIPRPPKPASPFFP